VSHGKIFLDTQTGNIFCATTQVVGTIEQEKSMKKIVKLLILSTLLAGCSSNINPIDQSETLLSSQAADSGFSLSVLSIGPSSFTATVKTPYPAATLCTLDWGDGSFSKIATPTSAGIYNHNYSLSGNKTVVFKCIARKLVLGVQKIDISTDNIIDFENPVVFDGQSFETFTSNGYDFSNKYFHSPGFGVYIGAPTLFRNCCTSNLTETPSQFLSWFYLGDSLIIKRSDGASFSLKQFDFASWAGIVSNYTVTGYFKNGLTITKNIETTSTNRSPMLTQVFDNSWGNLSRVEISGNTYIDIFGGNYADEMLLDNLKVVP
jgi:hypothetical protein